ncbi:MAG: hypothetical protein ACHREM_32330, partial [Polyangiales bacterium]
MHPPQWHATIGSDLFATLAKLGVVVPCATPADWYACPGHKRGCPRRVVPTHGYYGGHEFVAVCGEEDSACDDIFLDADARVVWTVSIDELVRHVRRVLGIGGAVERGDVGFPEVTRLGERGGRAVYLARAADMPGFSAWLGSRGDALVLAVDSRGIATAVRDRFAVGQRVELVLLADAVRFEGGALVGALAPPAAVLREPAVPTNEPSAAVSPAPATPTCVLIDRDGYRPITTREYEALVARAADFDLFIDTSTVVDGGGHRARRRDEDGTASEAVLTRHEAAALVELVVTRRSLRAGEFKQVAVDRIDKLVERARTKVDLNVGRFAWRAFHTLKGATTGEKQWR